MLGPPARSTPFPYPTPFRSECHSTFVDPGATATDACVGNVNVTVSGTVNANTVGNYTLTYSATDGVNTSTKMRTMQVRDTVGPVITLVDSDPLVVECHSTFV